MADELDALRRKRPCAAAGCTEQVAFSLFAGLAVGRDEPKYHGTCANGHPNVLTASTYEQWVEDDQ